MGSQEKGLKNPLPPSSVEEYLHSQAVLPFLAIVRASAHESCEE